MEDFAMEITDLGAFTTTISHLNMKTDSFLH